MSYTVHYSSYLHLSGMTAIDEKGKVVDMNVHTNRLDIK